MNNNILYVIIPFFSFGNYELRKKNLEICLKYLKNFSNINIIICNGVYQNNSLENESFIKDDKITYIKYELSSILWIKENLINLTIESLPNDWEYVCWIDSDIIFLNQNWVDQTIEHLKNNDAVQLLEFVMYLDEYGSLDFGIDIPYHKAICPSSAYVQKNEKNPGYAPTGLGWAITKNFYKKINKFFEYSIIGCGDFIFASAALQITGTTVAKGSVMFKNIPSDGYKKYLTEYCSKFNNCKFNYTKGLICHLWHGKLSKRQYENRWDILMRHEFDPDKHLYKNDKGIINISNAILENDLLHYFKERGD